ncbi:MAG: PAS domain S-box protein [Bacteroidota bacterium]|nr:PAS domain S-box protein [Bacteroidota bacterium]
MKSAQNKSATNNTPFPIVAIGGSAGALSAISEILTHLPPNTGMAYIYLQHLNPNYESNLTTILGKKSRMPVVEGEDHLPVEPDYVYVIPPNKEMTIEAGYLKVAERPREHYDYMPINRFFASLADNYKELAIGIVLSGTASDGTYGLKAIKMAGGLTFAQDDSAQFGSMPKNAVAEGAVDLVLAPKEIAEELENIAKQKEGYYAAIQGLNEETIGNRDEDLMSILTLLQKTVGVDFSQYKMSTIKRRIIRRVILNKMETLPEYLQYIKVHPHEINQLYQDMLINVTSFFRDPELTEYLRTTLLPEIIKAKKHNEAVRVWVPACSTGQEAYSLAMLLVEALGEAIANIPVQVFATDLSETAINRARLGVYSSGDIQGISPQRLQRFFIKVDGSYRINKNIRDLCIFAVQNIAKDPPFSHLDLISCCNVLIYIENNLQKKILGTFHYSLNNNGYLILGKSEAVGSSAYLFTQVDKRFKVYAKKKDAVSKAVFEINYNLAEPDKGEARMQKTRVIRAKAEEEDLNKAVDNLLLKKYTPASVIINHDMDIVQFRGSTGLFLEPSPGKASLNLLKMARSGLSLELRNLVHKAQKSDQPARKEGLEIKQHDKRLHVNIEALPLKTETDESYLLVVFEEVIATQPNAEGNLASDQRAQQLEAELEALREDIRAIVEAQEAANEELQSANEEILSSNEELQSINEELETSKEEIESSNEELITINRELQLRNEQLAETYEYSEAVFTTVRESLLILNKDLRVKAANPLFYKTFGVWEKDTEGRLLYDLGNRQWNIPELRHLLEEIIPENNYFNGFEVTHHFPGIGEKVMLLNARRITQKIHGEQVILLAIEDITEHRKAQKMLEEREAWFHNIADNAPVMMWLTDKEKKAKFFNKAWLEFRGQSMEEALQKGWTDGMHPDDCERTLKIFNDAFDHKLPLEFKYRVQHQHNDYVWLHNKAKANFTPEGQFMGYIGSCVVIQEVLDEGIPPAPKGEA